MTPDDLEEARDVGDAFVPRIPRLAGKAAKPPARGDEMVEELAGCPLRARGPMAVQGRQEPLHDLDRATGEAGRIGTGKRLAQGCLEADAAPRGGVQGAGDVLAARPNTSEVARS